MRPRRIVPIAAGVAALAVAAGAAAGPAPAQSPAPPPEERWGVDPATVPPSVSVGRVARRLPAADFERLVLRVGCSRPAEVRVTFRADGDRTWTRSVAAGPARVDLAVEPPPEVRATFIGVETTIVGAHAACHDEAGVPGSQDWETAFTVVQTRPVQQGRCAATWRRSYRLRDLLGPGLAVPVRCDSATAVSFAYEVEHEERLGIPTGLWIRRAGVLTMDMPGTGSRTARLRPQAWVRPYLRRARRPFTMTVRFGVATDGPGLFRVRPGPRLRIVP